VLGPAIRHAEHGFPLSPADAASWLQYEAILKNDPGCRQNLVIDGRVPRAGEVLVQTNLARTLRMIAEGGRDAFYRGSIAEGIVRFSEVNGGFFSRADLAEYRAEWQQPIGIDYRGHRVLECPPNGQGIAALLALRAVETVDFKKHARDSAQCWHLLIEATKHGMTETARFVADPAVSPFDAAALLSRAVPPLAAKASDPSERAASGSDTVFLAIVDEAGNAVSFINSVYGDFGSAYSIPDLGFILQNRGCGFSLDPSHPNCLAPKKRPYHTIIPGMTLQDGRPSVVFGITGGFLQPQGHLQLLTSLLDYGLDVQSAIDMPRFWWEERRRVMIEDGMPDAFYAQLAALGHEIVRRPGRRGFGGAQIISLNHKDGVLIGGSEPRQDGCAIGY